MQRLYPAAHRDAWSSGPVGIIIYVAGFAAVAFFGRNPRAGYTIGAVLTTAWVRVIVGMVARGASWLAAAWLSNTRELMADATAVDLTRDPQAASIERLAASSARRISGVVFGSRKRASIWLSSLSNRMFIPAISVQPQWETADQGGARRHMPDVAGSDRHLLTPAGRPGASESG